jgi:hypothetical protein
MGAALSLHPTPRETLYLVLNDSKKAKRGTHMDAVAKMKESLTDEYMRGHQYVGAILVFHDHVISGGSWLYVTPEDARVSGFSFHLWVTTISSACKVRGGI